MTDKYIEIDVRTVCGLGVYENLTKPALVHHSGSQLFVFALDGIYLILQKTSDLCTCFLESSHYSVVERCWKVAHSKDLKCFGTFPANQGCTVLQE